MISNSKKFSIPEPCVEWAIVPFWLILFAILALGFLFEWGKSTFGYFIAGDFILTAVLGVFVDIDCDKRMTRFMKEKKPRTRILTHKPYGGITVQVKNDGRWHSIGGWIN